MLMPGTITVAREMGYVPGNKHPPQPGRVLDLQHLLG